MRTMLFVLMTAISSVTPAAELRPFAITCSQLVVGPAETVKSLLRIDWDGLLFTSTLQNVNDQLDRHVEQALGSRLLAPDSSDDVRMSIHTGIHAEKKYYYYTALHFFPASSGGSLTVMFATVDKDGFLIDAGSVEYAGCELEFLTTATF